MIKLDDPVGERNARNDNINDNRKTVKKSNTGFSLHSRRNVVSLQHM